MTLAAINYKISYLQEKLSLPVLRQLEKYALKLLEPLGEQGVLPDATKPYLLIEVLYPLVRHHLWVAHPSFRDTLLHYMMEHFRLERQGCQRFVASLCQILARIHAPPKVAIFHEGDKHFYFYIFVLTLSHKTQEALLCDLGLGTSLLKQFKQAAHYFAQAHKQAEGKIIFGSDRDLVLCEVLTELSEHKAKSPWMLDLFNLYYLLADAPAPWDSFLHTHGCQTICDWLVLLGKKKEQSRLEARSWFLQKGFYPQLAGLDASQLLESLLAFLERRDLIYCRYAQKKKFSQEKEGLLYLSPRGSELTAQAFAASHGPLSVSLGASLVQYPGSWQAALLASLPREEDQGLLKLLQQKVWLAPEALAVAFDQLAQSQEPGAWLDFLPGLLEQPASILASGRAALWRSLGQLSLSPKLQALLRQTAQEDPCQPVREAALELLFQRGELRDLAQLQQYPPLGGRLA